MPQRENARNNSDMTNLHNPLDMRKCVSYTSANEMLGRSEMSFMGFNRGDSVKDKRTGETVTLGKVWMRGDAAIVAEVSRGECDRYTAELCRFEKVSQ
jgi:hypothetical protein